MLSHFAHGGLVGVIRVLAAVEARLGLAATEGPQRSHCWPLRIIGLAAEAARKHGRNKNIQGVAPGVQLVVAAVHIELVHGHGKFQEARAERARIVFVCSDLVSNSVKAQATRSAGPGHKRCTREPPTLGVETAPSWEKFSGWILQTRC